jgi:hypothetical protein
MTTDEPGTLPAQDRAPLAQRNASEIGAMMAAKVREAIDSAESSARQLRERALARAASDHGAVDRAADEVLAEIDAIEAKVAGLLQDVREEVMQIAGRAKDPEPESAAHDSGPPDEPDQPALEPAEAIPQRRGGRFWRRRAPQQCDVCGRAARPDEQSLELWRHEGRMGLCPECQTDGWRLPAGGAVPYRVTAQGGPG